MSTGSSETCSLACAGTSLSRAPRREERASSGGVLAPAAFERAPATISKCCAGTGRELDRPRGRREEGRERKTPATGRGCGGTDGDPYGT